MKKKGRGLTFDQKREKMLKIFHDTVFFTLFRKLYSTTKKFRSYL